MRNFWRTIEMIVDRLGAKPIAIQLPIGAESGFKGMIDLIANRTVTYTDDLGTTTESNEIPAELNKDAEEAREHMIALIAETDDVLGEKYLNGEEITADELRAGLRRATIGNKLVPVFAAARSKTRACNRSSMQW